MAVFEKFGLETIHITINYCCLLFHLPVLFIAISLIFNSSLPRVAAALGQKMCKKTIPAAVPNGAGTVFIKAENTLSIQCLEQITN